MKALFTYLLLLLFLTPFYSWSQKTIVKGFVKEADTDRPLEFVKVYFLNTKHAVTTDSSGYFFFETYYTSDTLVFQLSEYATVKRTVNIDKTNDYSILMELAISNIEAVLVQPQKEPFSTKLHKLIIKNKPINNREKLENFEYESYTKMRFDIANLSSAFKARKLIQKIKVVNDYLDSTATGKLVLPFMLTESVSKIYFNRSPRLKKEELLASKVIGIDVINLDQFTGEMYADINVYDNYIRLFNKQFVSPIANFARNYYNFSLKDSSNIDGYWCYELTFTPKRTGDLTFEGSLFVHDTTYAVKSISGKVSKEANLNFINEIKFEQRFEEIEPEVWMLTFEHIFADAKLTKKTKLLGIHVHRSTYRKEYKINQAKPIKYYQSNANVVISDSAQKRSDLYWDSGRQDTLNKQEKGVSELIDTLTNLPLYRFLKGSIYMISTGFWKQGLFEYGNIYQAFSYNPVEHFRTGFQIRTSTKFSSRVELMGRLYYGFGDNRFKYGGRVRYNVTPQKRGMLSAFYNYDIEQIGASPTATTVGSTFGTLFRTGPLDKLTFVKKMGIDFEKDLHKDIVLFGGFQWKEYQALGLANYVKINPTTNSLDTIQKIRNSEITFRFRWSKKEEFIAGKFDRKIVRSRYPVLSFQAVFGVKGLFGSDYSYQKLDFMYDHQTPIGVLGNIRYGFGVGAILGTAAYPFLKIHEGNQSYFLFKNAFNMMNYFEFISDKYVDAFIENHWGGLFLDLIPGVRKLQLRFVSSVRSTWGTLSNKNQREMILPNFTKSFGNIPYVECSVGIENILKVLRIDVFYRATHQISNQSPFGVRARIEFYL